MKPLTPYYFTQQSSNPNEQFYYFTSLFTWLLKLMNINFERPGQFDDPNAVSTNICNNNNNNNNNNNKFITLFKIFYFILLLLL